MNFTVPSPFGSPINPPSAPMAPLGPPPYPMSCFRWGEKERIVVSIIGGSCFGLVATLVIILGSRYYKNRPTMVKYNRKILTNMDTIPENQSMEDV